MPRSHWLDPLARQVLMATGQLAKPPLHAPKPIEQQPPSWMLDVNRATIAEWRMLPGCTNDMADLLVRLQQGGVQFAEAEDLFRLLDLTSEIRDLWQPHLIFHWYGDAPTQPELKPIDLNNADAEELSLLGWPQQRLDGLLRERNRAGFSDLADLQSRLCLPASAVEALIGRVRFETRRANGPTLPLRNGRHAA